MGLDYVAGEGKIWGDTACRAHDVLPAGVQGCICVHSVQRLAVAGPQLGSSSVMNVDLEPVV